MFARLVIITSNSIFQSRIAPTLKAGMEPVNISYRIQIKDEIKTFDYRLDPENYGLTKETASSTALTTADWTRLDHRKCSHCPLNSEEHPHCPLALQLQPLVENFHETSSIDQVELEMIRGTRKIIDTTSLQEALGSILEVLYPACGCPKTLLMRPHARFHIPSGSEEEKVYTVTSMYMLAQYFRDKTDSNGDFAFAGLIDFYADMSVLNKAIASRLTGATRSDSVKNAITLMDMYSTLIPLMLEEDLVEIRGIFKDFLPEEAPEKMSAIKNHVLERIKTAKLELIPLDEDSKDSEPDWLKEAKGIKADGNKDVEPAPRPEVIDHAKLAADEILKNSSLTLELVPNESVDDNLKTGKASFKLPDD